jgi:Replication initiator protein A
MVGESTKNAVMVGESTNDRSPLLPDRYPTADFFVCDIFDAAPKGDMASMAHPIFSLSTKPDHRIRRYESGDNYVEVKPSADGLATIHDRDILIYCISQIMAALNRGREVFQTVRFKAYDLLVSTNRNTAGAGYAQLKAALERLGGTRISTNITTGGVEQFDTFGLIDRATIVRETRDGRMQEVEVKLSDWMFNAIRHREVLTIHRDYFRLRKPLERRMYELARKHCGRKDEWRVSLATLQKKCGSGSTAREFKRLVQSVVREDELHSHMPDYAVRLEGESTVVFRSRKTMPGLQAGPSSIVPPLDPETYHDARTVAPGWDVHYLEQQWREWITEPPRDADAAFIGFCKKWHEKRGAP